MNDNVLQIQVKNFKYGRSWGMFFPAKALFKHVACKFEPGVPVNM